MWKQENKLICKIKSENNKIRSKMFGASIISKYQIMI